MGTESALAQVSKYSLTYALGSGYSMLVLTNMLATWQGGAVLDVSKRSLT